VALGPATISIGDNQSQSCFVEAGTQNINTNTDTHCVAASAPAISPRGLGLLFVGLIALGMRRLRRRSVY
jgi:hypothetical protein